MAQVTRMECDVCGKSAALDRADDWWSVQVSQRGAGAVAPPGFPNAPGMPPGMPGFPVPDAVPGVVEQPFGALKIADVCSGKCAQAFAKDTTTETKPTKHEKAVAETEAVEG